MSDDAFSQHETSNVVLNAKKKFNTLIVAQYNLLCSFLPLMKKKKSNDSFVCSEIISLFILFYFFIKKHDATI